MTVQEVYEQSIRGLPAADRLQLATLILNEISPLSIVNVSEEWSDEDLRDFSRASWNRIEGRLAETENAEAG